MSTPAPWTKYREHALEHARKDDDANPYYMRAFTPNDSGEWARQMRNADPAHGLKISEPTPGNPMQSAPHVLFASYDARNKYGNAAHARITKTHPYAITTYAEGDLITEFYQTAEARDRALFLLERAI
jgi:hypothetical protein